MVGCGSPPPRIVAPLERIRARRGKKKLLFSKERGSRGLCRDPVFDVPAHALESNNSTPTSTVPSSTKRHKSINNLRASATIIVLRTPRGPLAVRASNHLASALSFWNIKNRQASWIMPRRTRALPDRANPFSRLREPLSSGEPVRPPSRAARKHFSRQRLRRLEADALDARQHQ